MYFKNNNKPDWDAILIKPTLVAKKNSLKNKVNMKHIFAIPLESGRLCSHFGHCQQFAIVDVDNNAIVGENLITPPPHEPGLFPAWLAGLGVTEVIAGGMGQRALDLFAAQNIKVNIGAQPKSPKELVTDWLKDSLQTGSNSCDH
jgi:predicted Fe-Mo cluster-binding NifX family protein